MQNSESGIPVLTEVLETPTYGVDLPERRAAARIAGHVPVEPITVLPGSRLVAPEVEAAPTTVGPLMQMLDAAALAHIEHELREAVLGKLLGKLDDVLEAHIRDQLADVLQSAVDNLACSLRAGLKRALDESISLAVATELEHLRNKKTNDSE